MSSHTQATATTVRSEIVVEAPIERARVELEHRNLDRHGEGWEGTRGAVSGGGGWPLYLQRFGGLFDKEGQ